MVSELLTLVEDPGGERITPALALRFLNDANSQIADALFPFMPARFRAVTTAAGSAATEFTLPSACVQLERLTVRESTSATTFDALQLPIEKMGAVDINNLYDASFANGQIFFAEHGDDKITIRPTLTSNAQLTYYFRKKPIEMVYDYGKGVYSVDAGPTYNFTDAIKVWSNNYWANQSAKVRFPAQKLGVEYDVSGSTSTVLTFSSAVGITEAIHEYEVYIPTNIPSKYHYLIVQQAQIIAEKRPEQIQKLQGEFQKTFALLTGGSQNGAL